MTHTVATGLFCESIREEKSGQETIVGIVPDNIEVAKLPGVLQLALYTRFVIDPQFPPNRLAVRLSIPEGGDIVNPIEESIFKNAIEDARRTGHPVTTVISKMGFRNIPVSISGRLTAYATIDDHEFVIASLHVKLAKASSAVDKSAGSEASNPAPAAQSSASVTMSSSSAI